MMQSSAPPSKYGSIVGSGSKFNPITIPLTINAGATNMIMIFILISGIFETELLFAAKRNNAEIAGRYNVLI